MIVSQLIGGLGNQMFQYATGRALVIKNKTDLLLDTSWFGNIENVDTKRVYELGCYPVVAQLIDGSNLRFDQDRGEFELSLRKLLKSSTLKLKFHAESNPGFHSIIPTLPDNVYLRGFWQNEKYFMDIRSNLTREFKPKKISDYSQRLASKIAAGASVSIHVRRADYASNPLTNKFHGLTPVQYYVEALKIIEAKHGKTSRYIFSDDLDWCKDNLPFAKDSVFVDENGGDRAHEDIFLMSHCSHNIIANSSFSWWGAWLNENLGDVVAPKQWFRDKRANDKMEIIPDRWIKL